MFMKYEYYNPDYVNMNCVLRSFSKALNRTPFDIENELMVISKDYRKEKVFDKYLSKNSFTIINTYNGKNLLDTNLVGTNIAYAKDKSWYHLVCIIDNCVYDKASLEELSNMRIIKIYRLK